MRRIGEGTKHYRKQTLVALRRSWPALAEKNVRKITEREVGEWAERFAAEYSPTRYNNTLDTLRALFEIAVAAGARTDLCPGDAADRIRREPRRELKPWANTRLRR